MMNARERFQNTMHFQPVDRVPLTEIGLWEQTIERWRAEGMPPRVPERGNTRLVYGSEFFGLDRMEVLDIEFNMIPGFKEEVLEEDNRYMIIRRPDGRITKALKEGMVRGMRASMDEYIDFPVKCREDWEALKWRYNPESPTRYPLFWEDRVRCLRDRDYPLHVPAVGSTKLNGFYSSFRNWMGTEKACTVFYDDPGWAHEMCDFIADMIITTLQQALSDVDFDFFLWHEDFAFKTGPLVSPHIFQKFLLPRYRRVNDFLHSFGIDLIFLDTDGDPRVLIPLLIEAGINGLMPLEAAANQDPVALRREYGHDLLLWGGIDKRALAQDKAAIEAELQSKLPPLLEDGGYLPTLDHTAPPDIPYQNFLYYLDLKRKIVEGG